MSENINLKPRNQSIDILKGLGIILVVMGHLDTNGQVSRLIVYSFHMPLFFFLSGVVAKSVTEVKFIDYFKKIIKTIYLPFFVFVILDIVFKVFYQHQHSFLVLLKRTILDLTGLNFTNVNSPLWFLLALFVCKFLFYFIDKKAIYKYICLVVCVIFIFTFRYFETEYYKSVVYFWTIPGLAFFIVGNLLRKFYFNINDIVNRNKIICGVILLFSLITYIALFDVSPFVSMKELIIPNPLLYIINSILGIILITAVSMVIQKSGILSTFFEFYGKNSIIVLICHYYFTRKIVEVLFEKIGIIEYLYSWYTQIILLIITLIIMAILIFISKKYLYFLFGLKKEN